MNALFKAPPLRSISLYIYLPVQFDAMNALFKAPPLRRGGGSVCRDGGVFTVICAKLLNIAQALRRTLPSRFAIHLPLVREGADWCELHAPPTYVEGYVSRDEDTKTAGSIRTRRLLKRDCCVNATYADARLRKG